MRCTQYIYRLAGSPDCRRPTYIATEGDVCCWCGMPDAVLCSAKKVFGTHFTARVFMVNPNSPHACRACTWAFGGKPPDTIRLWSVVARTDIAAAPSNPKSSAIVGVSFDLIHCTTKGKAAEIIDVLIAPPDSDWVCCIAESAQQHVLPYAVINRGSPWKIRWENIDVAGDSKTFAEIIYHATALIGAGFFRIDVLTGEPSLGRLGKLITKWKEHDNYLSRLRGSPLFDLAVGLISKDTEGDYHARAAKALGRRIDFESARLDSSYDEERKHRQDTAKRLVEQSQKRAGDSICSLRNSRADGQQNVSETGNRKAETGKRQLSLFNI